MAINSVKLVNNKTEMEASDLDKKEKQHHTQRRKSKTTTQPYL